MGKVSLSCQSFLEVMQHVSNCIDGSIDCEVCVHGGGRGALRAGFVTTEVANMDWGCGVQMKLKTTYNYLDHFSLYTWLSEIASEVDFNYFMIVAGHVQEFVRLTS